MAHRLGRIDAGRVDEHRRVVAAYDLPTLPPARRHRRAARPSWGGTRRPWPGLTFVLDGPAGVEAVAGLDAAVVRDALREFFEVAA